jgi:hypothetical protein
MDIYHVSCALKDGVSDTDFHNQTTAYCEHLKTDGLIAGYRLMRRKLGLGPSHLPEFHLMIEAAGLAQVSSRAGPVEALHHAVDSLVPNVTFALYRGFPDSDRVRGRARF